MTRAIFVSAVALGLNACAYVPEVEDEASFSYGEILNQAECEIYWAGENIRLEKTDETDDLGTPSYSFPEYRPDNYSAKITINPTDTIQSDLNFGDQFKTSTKGTHYFQWMFASSSPVSNASGIDGFGKAAGTNTYNLNVSNLYEQIELKPKNKNQMISYDPAYKDDKDEHIVDQWEIVSSYTKPSEIAQLPGKNLPASVPKIIRHVKGMNKLIAKSKDPEAPRNDDYCAIVDTSPYVGKSPSDTPMSKASPYYFFSILPGCEINSLLPKGVRAQREISSKIYLACQAPPAPASDPGLIGVSNPLNGGLGIQGYLQRTIAANGNGLGSLDALAFEKEYKATVQLGVTAGWYIPRGDYLPNFGASKSIDDDIKFAFATIEAPQPTAVYLVNPPKPASAAASRQARKDTSPSTDSRLNNTLNLHVNDEIMKSLQQFPPQ